jgi:hypothetical protein
MHLFAWQAILFALLLPMFSQRNVAILPARPNRLLKHLTSLYMRCLPIDDFRHTQKLFLP